MNNAYVIDLRMVCVLALLAASHSPALLAQAPKNPNVHYLMSENAEPGLIAHSQIARRIPGAGSFQAVEVSGPKGMGVALARDGQFLHDLEAPVKVGMMVGAVYRLRVSGIPFREGEEVYPTIEVIDRIFAPTGREHRFPIPIVIEEADLRAALSGNLVTRVIYLEDSEVADPVAVKAGTQKVFDVGPMDNALKMADQLGRPVAILRIGSRVPANLQGDLAEFLYGCPPWIPLATVPTKAGMVQSGIYPDPPVEASEQLLKYQYEKEPRIPIR
jgi:hypothetical protein